MSEGMHSILKQTVEWRVDPGNDFWKLSELFTYANALVEMLC